jgi:hypothetical protein
MSLDLDDLQEGPKGDLGYKVREKGFGVCKSCGKHTMGKSNDLCSRCGGTPVIDLLGMKYDYHLDPVKHTLTDLKTGKVTKDAKGFPAPKGRLVYFDPKEMKL